MDMHLFIHMFIHIYTHVYKQNLFCPLEDSFIIYKGILSTQTCPRIYLDNGS